MKKKLIALLAVVFVICCALGLVACDKDTTVEVAEITLDETQLTVTQGDTARLTATVTPSDATDQKIEWTSSNHSVAIVEDGYIVTFGEGTTTITATSNNGKTAQCEITVEADPNDNYVMQFDVKFDANGGKFADGSTHPVEKTVNWGDRLDPVTVTREGKYKFEGWYIKGQPATGAWDFSANGVFNDITLYAKWDYQNSYDFITPALEFVVQNYHRDNGKEDANVDVDILAVYKDSQGFLRFVGKDKYGVAEYRSWAKDFDDVTDILSDILYSTIIEVDSYGYYYNSDNYSSIVDYLPGKYIENVDCSVIYACVTDWVYDANNHLSTPGPWYSCKVKALMVDDDGNVFTYSATIVSGTTNFNLVLGGSYLSEEFDEEITQLGDIANDYYAEYLKDKEASILY